MRGIMALAEGWGVVDNEERQKRRTEMAESITINFVGREVGIQYHPETTEATFRDEMIARETGAHALIVQAIQHRLRHGIPLRASMVALAEDLTFNDLL